MKGEEYEYLGDKIIEACKKELSPKQSALLLFTTAIRICF